MAGSGDEIASRADAAADQAGLSGDVSSVAATCPRTVLEIGIFFDGTGNNEDNAKKGGNSEDSYGNARSNVSLLKDLYKNKDYDVANENGTGLCRKFRAYYMPGIGTINDGQDSKAGKAVGMGSTGVWRRVREATEKLGEAINELGPAIPPEEIILDVFGFSRGAAAARHFVNSVRGGLVNYLMELDNKSIPVLKLADKIRFRFVGIFDTVASIGLGKVEYNYAVNVHLKTAQAEKIFHLTAMHEYRENFRLNHNLDGGGDHYEMPGAHSDVGGGYRDNGDKAPVAGTKTFEHTDRAFIEYLHELQSADTAEMNTKYRKQPVLDGFVTPDQAGAVNYIVSAIREMEYPGTFGGTMTYYAFDVTVIADRSWVRLGLSRVAMAAMHRQALAQNVPFLSLPTRGEYEIPADLQAIAQKIISLAKLTPEEIQFVASNYVHISANPDSIGMSRESKLERIVYMNKPGSAI